MSVYNLGAARQATRITTLVGVLIAGGTVSCSSLDPASDSCVTLGASLAPDCDPSGSGGSGGGGPSAAMLPENWRCLAEGFEPEPIQPAPGAAVTYTGFVLDYRLQSSMVANVRPCVNTDFECAMALLGEGVPAPSPPGDPRPRVMVTLPKGFQGFLRMTATDYVTQDYYLGGPMMTDVVSTQPFSLVSITSLGEFIRGVGAEPAEVISRGVMALRVVDCDGVPAPGVTLRLPGNDGDALEDVLPWAIQPGGLPVANRPTNVDGLAGFINLPISNVFVEGEVNGVRFGGTTFRIEANRMTTGELRPFYNQAR